MISASQSQITVRIRVAVVLLAGLVVAALAADAPRPQMKNMLAFSNASARSNAEQTPPAAKAQTVEASPLPGVPAAVFNDEPGSGVDPFFPNTRRRPAKPQPAAVATPGAPHTAAHTPAQPAPPRPAPAVGPVALRGIVGTPQRRLALLSVNGKTCDVRAGEEILFKSGDSALRATCIEVRERSVVLRIEGETADREVKLKDGI
jgi:hypothetical protein